MKHREYYVYLGTSVTNQNVIQEEIKRRLNSGNSCYHSFQNILCSRLLSKNIKIQDYNLACGFVRVWNSSEGV
jgi:hypothetical protein